MLPVFINLLFLLAAAKAGRPHDIVNSAILERQSQDLPSRKCNATCSAFAAVRNCRGVPHCGCSTRYLQAQGDCLFCQTSSPRDAAAVQLFLDAEMNQCYDEGIPINFRLQLPPEAQVIVDKFNRDSASLRQRQTAFLALQIAGGHIGLVIILALAVFSSRVRRDPTFLNFCITWIFSSIVYSLMLYRGTRGNTIVNPLGLVSLNKCLVQASLTNGAQVMTACSTMALVIQFWIGLRAGIRHDCSHGLGKTRWTTCVLLMLPYFLFLAFAITSGFVGNTRTTVEDTSFLRAYPANFYCSIIELKPFLRAIYCVTLGLLLVTAGFDALIIVILYRNWRAFRRIQTESAVSLSRLLRVMIFSIYRVVVPVTYGTALDMAPPIILKAVNDDVIAFSMPSWADLLEAAIPLIGFLVLGLNDDMLTGLMFWRKDMSMATMQNTNIPSSSGACMVGTWNENGTVHADTKHIPAEVWPAVAHFQRLVRDLVKR